MTSERLYSALLRLYPSSFRREYGDGLHETFRQLVEERRGSRAAFWLFIVSDVAWSALSLRLDAWRSDVGRFALEWAAACACGAVVTALLANALTSGFAYLYHPYLEGITLAPWTYGALLGTGLGVTQAALLRRRGGLALVRRAIWLVLGSTAALSLAALSFATRMRTTFEGLNPLSQMSRGPLATQPHLYDAAVSFLLRGLYAPATQTDVVMEFAVMVTSGLVIAAVTMKPLARLYAHPK